MCPLTPLPSDGPGAVAHILGGVTSTNATGVFAEYHIQYPVHTFYSPVLSNRIREFRNFWRTAADVVASFHACFFPFGGDIDCLADAFCRRPF